MKGERLTDEQPRRFRHLLVRLHCASRLFRRTARTLSEGLRFGGPMCAVIEGCADVDRTKWLKTVET